MITLYGFGRIFRAGIGETKDLRVEWALQETGLPYRVHALDHTAGELKLIPSDVQGRTRVTQWCFAAVSTVAPTLSLIGLGDIAGLKVEGREMWIKIAKRWLDGLERRLDGREWIACKDFTVADILLATVLREVRETDLMAPYPRLKDFYARALARPAWQRTLDLYAERLGVAVADIR